MKREETRPRFGSGSGCCAEVTLGIGGFVRQESFSILFCRVGVRSGLYRRTSTCAVNCEMEASQLKGGLRHRNCRISIVISVLFCIDFQLFTQSSVLSSV